MVHSIFSRKGIWLGRVQQNEEEKEEAGIGK